MIATPTNNAPRGPSPSTTPTMSRSVAKTPSTPSTAVSATTSTQSRCDYSCYTLRKTEQGDILAVISAANMEESSQQAVAQLMGYVSAFAKDGERPPLAIVVTQTRVECLLFPFKKDGERLLKASAFILNLWKENRYSIDLKVFRILGSLINEDVRRSLNVSVQRCKNWEKMRVIVQITSDKAGEVAVMAQQLKQEQEARQREQEARQRAEERADALRKQLTELKSAVKV